MSCARPVSSVEDEDDWEFNGHGAFPPPLLYILDRDAPACQLGSWKEELSSKSWHKSVKEKHLELPWWRCRCCRISQGMMSRNESPWLTGLLLVAKDKSRLPWCVLVLLVLYLYSMRALSTVWLLCLRFEISSVGNSFWDLKSCPSADGKVRTFSQWIWFI